MIKHIFSKLSVISLSLLSICLGFSGIWQPTQLLHWLAAGCLDSWPLPQAHKSALYLFSVGGLASLSSRDLQMSAAQDCPQNTTLNYRTGKVAARISIHVFCMYTISIYRFNTSQGHVKASGCSVFSCQSCNIIFFFLSQFLVSSYSIRHGPIFSCDSTQTCNVLYLDI